MVLFWGYCILDERWHEADTREDVHWKSRVVLFPCGMVTLLLSMVSVRGCPTQAEARLPWLLLGDGADEDLFRCVAQRWWDWRSELCSTRLGGWRRRRRPRGLLWEHICRGGESPAQMAILENVQGAIADDTSLSFMRDSCHPSR